MRAEASVVVVAGLVAGLLGASLAGCATTPVEERAVFSLDEDVIGPKGQRCGRKVQVIHGPAPANTTESVRYIAVVTRPVALGEFEALLQSNAARVCADGVAILQAVVEDGAGKVSSVNAVAWIETPPAEAAAQKQIDDDNTVGFDDVKPN